MASRRRGEITTSLIRALASVAIFAQLLMTFAPMIEVRDGGAQTASISLNHSSTTIQSGTEQQRAQHDASSCPACIAQSLHAELQSGVRIPTATFASRLAEVFSPTPVLASHLSSTHKSRAPPAIA